MKKTVMHSEVLIRAKDYGYNNFVALVPRDSAEKRLKYAYELQDFVGINIALMLIKNINAYEKALEELSA